MKIAIIGYGVEGQAAYDYWREGNEITICDQNNTLQVPAGTRTQLGDGYLQGLEQFDVIVRSPNVHPRLLIAAASEAILDKVTSNTNEFLRVCPTKNVIGITGTKGKGTTSTLVTKMLQAAGKTVHLGGNIGIAPLNLLKNNIQADDWVVLELSNFQLIDAKRSPSLAACLLVVPEHLDWHLNTGEYVAAKQQLFRWQTARDVAVYYPESQYSQEVVSVTPGHTLPYMQVPGAIVENDEIKIDAQVICSTHELKLLGKHNWQNVCAALTLVWQITQDVPAIKSVLTSFAGLPFRIELRREVNGIRYYNDSFASGPEATLAALQTVPEKKVLILGGFDRGLYLGDLARGLQADQQNIRHVLVIGASGERLAAKLEEHKYTNFVRSEAKTMSEIVAEATKLAEPGDAVLLSPAFASFDMFKNFEDRGRQFNQAVEAL